MSDKVINIGELEGPLLVFGGVYSNLQALERLIQIAQDKGIDPNNVICTGDVVGYCAQPVESVNLIREWGIHVIAGNVELKLAEGSEECGCDFTSGSRCDTFSRNWYPFAQSKMTEREINWMKRLPEFIRFSIANKEALVVHGSLFETSEFIFKSTDWGVKLPNFEKEKVEMILAGHCGLPFIDVKNGLTWANAGVIGMPANDGQTDVWYMIVDVNERGELTYSHSHFDYDHSTAARLMEENHLPKEYAHTLRTGVWDNCEILPDVETARQGETIVF